MALFIVFKALIIGALLGALIMFLSSFAGGSKNGSSLQAGYPSRLQVIFRFFLKLTVFILLLIIPFFLLKVIL
jgi:hypothetical protein